mgnify:CR=1 FL=1
MPRVAVVIVNWNVRDLLAACLTSLYADLDRAGLEAQVWVVDNASTDGSPEMVRSQFPQVRLIANRHNAGFAAGNNQALREVLALTLDPDSSSEDAVLLLNPDTEVQPGALAALVDWLKKGPRAAVIGARLSYSDGSFQHSAFRFPRLMQIAFDLFPLPPRLYESRLNGRYPRALYERGAPFEIDHPLGAAMLVRSAAIRQVGLLDEGFHMYCEEIDWCMRMRAAGWRAYCVPRAHVLHYAARSTGQIRTAAFVHLWRSRQRLYAKHYGLLTQAAARALVLAGMRYQAAQARRAYREGRLDATTLTAQLAAFAEVAAIWTEDGGRKTNEPFPSLDRGGEGGKVHLPSAPEHAGRGDPDV